MAYDNKRRGRAQDGEAPVRFKDGQPVFREERSYGNRNGSGKPYYKGNSKGGGGGKPYGAKRTEDGGKDTGRRRYEGDEKPYYKKRYEGDERPYYKRQDGAEAPRAYGKRPYSEKSGGEDGVRTRYGKQPYPQKNTAPEREDAPKDRGQRPATHQAQTGKEFAGGVKVSNPEGFTERLLSEAIPRHAASRNRFPGTAIPRQRLRAATPFQKGGVWER